MPLRKIECAECGTTFEAQRANAKYCKAACRVRANRRPAKQGAAEPETPNPTPPPGIGGLMSQVAAELSKLEALDTISGRAALALAYRIESPMESGSAAAQMTKELSRLVEEAKAAVAHLHRDAGDEIEDRVQAKLRLVQ